VGLCSVRYSNSGYLGAEDHGWSDNGSIHFRCRIPKGNVPKGSCGKGKGVDVHVKWRGR